MRHHTCILIAILLVIGGCAEQAAQPASTATQSGLQKGADIVPWNPIHVAGPNKGTNACPICTYEARPAIQIFTKQGPNVPLLATRLEQLVDQQQKRDLKGFIIVLDSTPNQLKQMGEDLKIQKIGLCYPDPETRDSDLKAYKINPAVMNTVVVYKDYKVVATFVNLDAADFDRVEAVVNHMP